MMMAQALSITQFTEALVTPAAPTVQGGHTDTKDEDFRAALRQATDPVDVDAVVPAHRGDLQTATATLKLTQADAATGAPVRLSPSGRQTPTLADVKEADDAEPSLLGDDKLSPDLSSENDSQFQQKNARAAGAAISARNLAEPGVAVRSIGISPSLVSPVTSATQRLSLADDSSSLGPVANGIPAAQSLSAAMATSTQPSSTQTAHMTAPAIVKTIAIQNAPLIKGAADRTTPAEKIVAVSKAKSSVAEHVGSVSSVQIDAPVATVIMPALAVVAGSGSHPVPLQAVTETPAVTPGLSAMVGAAAAPILPAGASPKPGTGPVEVTDQNREASTADALPVAPDSGLHASRSVVLGAAGEGGGRPASEGAVQGAMVGSTNAVGDAAGLGGITVFASSNHAGQIEAPAILQFATIGENQTGSSPLASRLEGDVVAEGLPHTILSATPTALEVGVPSGTHGWLKIRAELNGAGGVNASLTGTSSASAASLRSDLPALSSYLEAEKIQVGGVAVHTTVHTAEISSGDLVSTDGGRSVLGGQGDLPGGTSGKTAQDTAQQPGAQGTGTGAGSGAKGDEKAPAVPVDTLSDAEGYGLGTGLGGNRVLSPVEYGAGGGWLNVRA